MTTDLGVAAGAAKTHQSDKHVNRIKQTRFKTPIVVSF
jgi:hypothetical protein